MGPPGGGRNPVTARLLRHFNFLAFTDMSDDSARRIFSTILTAALSRGFSEDILAMTDNIVSTTIEIYNTVRSDLLPTPADDVRLVPAALLDDTDDWAAWDAGRARTLSVTGRDQAAERWYADRSGPAVELARLAPAACATCGFFVPLAGDLGQLFGACANAFAPDDARVVAADHGCGAHSEVVAVAPEDVVAAPVVRSEYVDVEEIPDLVEASVDQDDEAAASADPATSEAAEVSGLADGAASNESRQMAAPSTESADSEPVVELDTPETNERETDEPVAHIGDDVPGETGDDTSALADGDGDSPR
jgi:hypothetical protein